MTHEVPTELDQGFIALSTRRPVAMLMVVATVVVFGVVSFRQLPRNLMPDLSYPTITVRTEYPGAAPIDVEDRLSERLESVLSQVKGLRRISSVSRAELSEIVLEFAWGTEMSAATIEVREKADQAVLPDEVERPMILRYDPTLDPILQLGFYETHPTGSLTPTERDRRLVGLRIDAEELIEKELELVAGVAAIEVRGGYEKEIRIDVDEDLLPAKDVTLELISRRLAEENQNLASGILDEADNALIVRSVNEFTGLEEIRNVVLRDQSSIPVRLRDVAVVSYGYKDPEVLTRFDDFPCVKIEVFKEAGANTVEVATRVRERIYGTVEERARLAEIDRAVTDGSTESDSTKRHSKSRSEKLRRPDFLASRLPGDRRIVVMSDQSRFIQRALDEVRTTVIVGGIFAVAVLFVFLRNFWYTAIVGMSIPLSIIATFTALRVCGVSLNIMSLGGLALGVGMLVDSSIVVLESIFRCSEEGDSPRLAAVRGGKSVATAVTASTLTTVAVFFPIVFVEGVAGQVFRDQALAVVISLIAALGVSLSFIPTLIARRLHGASPGQAGTPPLKRFSFSSLSKARAFFQFFGKRPVVALLVAPVAVAVLCAQLIVELCGFVILVVVVGAMKVIRVALEAWQRVFMPLASPLLRLFDALWGVVEGSYPRLLRGALGQRGLVVAFALASGVVSAFFFRQLGTELIPEVHQGEFTVEVTLPIGTRIETTDTTIRSIEKEIAALPGVDSLTTTVGVEKAELRSGDEGEHFAQLLVRVKGDRSPRLVEEALHERIRAIVANVPEAAAKIRNPTLFNVKAPIEVEIRGYNLEKLREIAFLVRSEMEKIPSIEDVKSSLTRGYPELQISYNRELLIRYGLDAGKIGNAIRRKINGEVATRLTEGDRKVDIRVRLAERHRSSLKDLTEMRINSALAGEPPRSLYDVAEIVQGFGPSEIRRIRQGRAAVVTANLAGLDLGRATAAIEVGLERVDIPPDFHVGFGGQQSELEQSLESLAWALALAIFLVYVVMAAQFESLMQPFVILFSIPLASVGIAVALWVLDIPLSVIAFVGMIILSGIVVNNAIVLVDCINQLRREGLPKIEAIVAAGRIRLRPIFMTTATTVLGLLPLTGALNWIPGVASVLGVGEGLEIRAPMAITVIVGLLSSTVLTLVVVPVLYSFLELRDGD